MITIEQLRAQVGESISAKWRLLERFIEQQRAAHEDMTGPGLLKDQTGEGFAYRAAPQAGAVFEGAFFVALSGAEATVAAGTVDGITPRLSGTRIDGVGDTGKQGAIPKLKITGQPNEQLRSWICVEALRTAAEDSDQLAPLDETDPAALIITHRASLTDGTPPVAAQRAILPLAVVIWSDTRTPARVEQIVYFNQRTLLADGQLTFDEAA